MGDRNQQGAAPTGPEPSQVEVLQAENERLKAELAAVNNEFGSQTPDWPEAWKRVADLKQLAGDRWRENVDLKEQIHSLTTALAESERKRVEIIREVTSFVGCVEALQRHTNPFDVNEGHSRQWFAVHDAIQTRIKPRLSTPPQETPDETL